ncbi:hypothetical protein DXG01_008543 [Tephrocybe rancida]|nr:hypothetical protein DXG01_008543 [Tephrocybe rancida]
MPKCNTSAVNDAANNKLKPALEIKQELSKEEDQGGVRKKEKGKQRAKAPRQTRKTGGEKKMTGKGGKRGARHTVAGTAAISSTSPAAPTMSINTCQHHANTPIEEENP